MENEYDGECIYSPTQSLVTLAKVSKSPASLEAIGIPANNTMSAIRNEKRERRGSSEVRTDGAVGQIRDMLCVALF